MAPKRPRDPNQLAKSIIDIATGQKPDRDPTPEEQGKDPAAVIQEQAVVSLGPWPPDLELFIFVSKARWSCGLSPATQRSDLEYREGVLQIAREMLNTIRVMR